MAHTKKQIQDMHRLIERVDQTDKLLRALVGGKQLQLYWGGTRHEHLMVGMVSVPATAREEIRAIATKWRDEAKQQLDALGVELPKPPPDDIEEVAYVP